MRRLLGRHTDRSLRAHVEAMTAAQRLRRAQDEAAAARLDAEAARQTQSAFLSGLNHELRTPLNAITGFAGLLREKSSGEDQKSDEYLDHILHSADILLRRIDAILEAAAGVGAKVAPRGLADPVAILRRVLQEHASSLFVGKVNIEDGLPPTAMPSRDLYRLLQRAFGALTSEGPERRAVGLTVSPAGARGDEIEIRFSVLTGSTDLPNAVIRSLQSDAVRMGARLTSSSDRGTREIFVRLPALVGERAA